MGIKSKSNAMDMSSKHTEKGLIFLSKSGYYDLKNIDQNAYQLIDAMKAGSLDMKEFFSRFDKVKVKETYCEVYENIDIIFPNITKFSMMTDCPTELHFADKFNTLLDVEFFDD